MSEELKGWVKVKKALRSGLLATIIAFCLGCTADYVQVVNGGRVMAFYLVLYVSLLVGLIYFVVLLMW